MRTLTIIAVTAVVSSLATLVTTLALSGRLDGPSPRAIDARTNQLDTARSAAPAVSRAPARPSRPESSNAPLNQASAAPTASVDAPAAVGGDAVIDWRDADAVAHRVSPQTLVQALLIQLASNPSEDVSWDDIHTPLHAESAIRQLNEALLKLANDATKSESRTFVLDTGDSAIRLLGWAGSVRAVPTLLRGIALHTARGRGIRVTTRSEFPSVMALTEIGAVATPMLLDYLEKTPPEKIPDWHVRLYGYVMLSHAGNDPKRARLIVNERLDNQPAGSNLYRLYDWLVAYAQRMGG